MTGAAEKSPRRRIPHSQFLAELAAQGVQTHLDYAFVCPSCGTVQSLQLFMAKGIDRLKAERRIAFSCIGRVVPGTGCDWSLGGLFKIHTLEVEKDGEILPTFELATPEQAVQLRHGLDTATS